MAEGKPAGAICEPEVEHILVSAGNGDVQAYRALIDFALEAHKAGRVSLGHALLSVEMVARIAAAKGDPYDRMTLASLLFHLAQIEQDTGGSWSPIYQAEAVAILSDLANDGDELAAELLPQVADDVAPVVMQVASEMERLALASVEDKTVH